MAAQTASPRARAESSASPRSPKASDDWVISAKISSLSYGELKAIAYRHPGLIYNPHLTEKVRLFLAMELGLQRMALDTIATLRVSPYETSEEGVTILHLACAKGFAKILSLFQERKADLEATNERGETPLFVAAQAGHADIVEQLVKAGCRATTTNAHGVSALQVAALSGHLSVVQLLLKLGISDKGQTSAAMAHMLDRRGSSHRLIAHLLSMPAKPDFAALGEPRVKASESPKGTDSGNPRTMVLPRSASAEGPGRPRRGSDGGERDKHEKKHSGKKRLSKGASDGLALSKLVDRDEKKEERDREERREKEKEERKDKEREERKEKEEERKDKDKEERKDKDKEERREKKDKDERKDKDDKKEKKERDGKGSN